MKVFRKTFSVFMCFVLIITLIPFTASARATDKNIHVHAYNNDSYSSAKTYSGNDLGASYSSTATTFKVWSPLASSAKVNIYGAGSNSEAGGSTKTSHNMTKNSTNGVWSVTLNGDYKNKYYTYSFTFSDGTSTETADIYAKAAGVNGNRSMVVDLNSTNPEGWANDKHVYRDKITDAVIWEVHVGDFSGDASSGVSEANRGKYLAFTEKGTTVNGEGYYSTCVDYLSEQGINTVHIMPAFDFASVDETRDDGYNWGYDPKNYNVPEGSYSSNPYDGNVRIREFKQMVKALHDRGITVVMDVVYNHTYATRDSWFELTAPGYYYRMNGNSFYNGSGCGNVTRSESTMFRKYMIDSIKYWANEYHIDGFRFDLMGCHDITTMNQIRSALNNLDGGNGSKILMYGEPWIANWDDNGIDKTQAAVMENMSKLSSGIAAFNDKLRDAVKGGTNDSSKGFIQGGGNAGGLQAGIVANTSTTWGDNWASSPAQVIQYASAHDNLTLWDKIVISMGASNFDDLDNSVYNAINKLSGSISLTSAGTPFFQAGEEFARTKHGNNNSYNAGLGINSIKWSQLYAGSSNYTVTRRPLTDYYKGLMEIRSAFAPFRDAANTYVGSAKWYFSTSTDTSVGFTVTSNLSTGWKTVAVLHNAGTAAQSITLGVDGTVPTSWVVVANGTKAGLKSLGTKSGSTISVPARTTLILVDATSFNRSTLSTGKGIVTIQDIDVDTNKVITTRVREGKIGTAYTTCANNLNNFKIDYDYVRTEGNETGTFTSAGTTVKYYYKKYSGNTSTVTVTAKAGTKTLGTYTYKGREGSAYSVQIPHFSNYKLNTASIPAGLAGYFGSTNKAITLNYTAVAVPPLKVHFYTEYWTSPVAYMYNGDNENTKYLGDWAACLTNSNAKFSSAGSNWYLLNNSYVNSLKDENMRLIVRQADGEYIGQEPYGQGYLVKGEVWIQSLRVQYNTTVTASYVDTEGHKLSDDEVLNRTRVCDSEKYIVEAKEIDGYKLVDSSTATQTDNYSINHPINVVFVYEEESNSFVEPVLPVTLDFTTGDVNGDGEINLLDAYRIFTNIKNTTYVFEQEEFYASDINGDGSITAEDTQKLLNYLTGKVSSLDVKHIVSASVDGTGGKTSGSGIYDRNTNVTLTATPNSGYEFTGWYKNGELYSQKNPLTFALFENTTLKARFKEEGKFIITVKPTEGGTVSPATYNTPQSVEENTSLTFTATPDDGYRLKGWYDGKKLLTNANKLTFTVTRDADITAEFEPIPTYTVRVIAGDGGTITPATYITAQTVREGTVLTFTATPNSGYHFTGWYDNINKELSDKYTDEDLNIFSVNEDIDLTATFSDRWNVSVDVDPAGSGTATFTPASPVANNTSVTFTATPNSGYKFVGWYNDDGGNVSTANPYKVKINADTHLIAKFEKIVTDYTVYFTNNKFWSNVYIYMFNDNNEEYSAWASSPEMAYSYSNGYGEGVYKFTVPAKYNKLIFHNGAGEQTVDITHDPSGMNGYYLIAQNADGKWTVGQWNCTHDQSNTSSSSSSVSAPAPTPASTTRTIYFTNNQGWGNVYIYLFNNKNEELKPFNSSDKMTYHSDNDFKQGIFKFTFDSKYTKVVFHNGAGSQTEDVVIDNYTGNAFYPDVVLNGKYTVGSFTV